MNQQSSKSAATTEFETGLLLLEALLVSKSLCCISAVENIKTSPS